MARTGDGGGEDTIARLRELTRGGTVPAEELLPRVCRRLGA